MATESNETQPVSTEVTIGGQRFELKNMTAEQGAALYELLSPEDKKLADSIAAIAKNFHSLSSIELPPGMSVTTALEKYFGALKAGRGKIEDGAEVFLKQMDGAIGELPAVQGIRRLAGAANTAADVWDGAVRGLMAPYRALMATPGLASTLTPGTNVSDEQARAFGAAYAAAEAMHRAPAKEEGIGGFFASTSRTLGYGYMRLMHSLPFIPTVMSAIGHWFQGLPANWDFGAAWEKAKEEVASEQKAELNKYGGHMPTLEQYQTHARQVGMQEKARPAAAAMVTAAGSIAGIEAPKLVEAITKGGIIRTHEGGLAQVTIQDGRPVQEAAKGPNGEPLTVGDERRGMLDEALPQPGRGTGHHLAYGAAVGAGAVVGAAGLHGVAEGVARQTAGGQALAKASESALKESLKLEVKAASAEKAAARINGGGWRLPFQTAEKEAAKAVELREKSQTAFNKAATNEDLAKARVTKFEAGKFGRAAVEDLADKPKGFYTNIITKPFRWAGRAFGDMGGKIADGVGRLVGRSATNVVSGVRSFDAVEGITAFGKTALGKATPWITAGVTAYETTDGVKALVEGDGRRATESLTGAGTVVAGAGAGAAIGVWFFGVGAIPGALVGSAVGGIASIFSKPAAVGIYDYIHQPVRSKDKNALAQPGSTGTPDPGLAAAATYAEQNAQKARDQARYAMAGTKSTMLGAVHSVADGSTVQSSKVAFVPVGAAPISFDFA
ncbi:MAG: hypothetical protein ACK5R5_03785 [Alphaproteobacteria bacterium]